MVSRKPKSTAIPSPSKADAESIPTSDEVVGSILGTVSAPSSVQPNPKSPLLSGDSQKRLGAQKAGGQALAAARKLNPLKASEFGLEDGHVPVAGTPIERANPIATASTVSETNLSEKTGEAATPGHNPANASMQRHRVDSAGQAITTNMGVALGNNQASLKAGLRGPTLMEDFILREKITHFDHERIPERIVHARGSGAHGYFECYKPLTKLTRAAPFAKAGKRTPVFVRFSTVVGERGSTDLARDVRGFAVKFYTEEGNWDIVGNNIPVFFIQDAMKFPDLIHAVKPEPHNQMPQAASAHDTFWDFAGLMPEITHMLMWVMSDRAIPRSYRTMQGFGVHTFRLVNQAGESVFCKFHWNPLAGTHSVVWDEAVKISGADPDFHRRDLWEAIEAGAYPEWELGLQVFTEAQAEQFSFDVLDSTKLIPEELVPVRPVGKLVLDRNPDNFFAETEQIAFGTANVIPGIDFSNDPLLMGRHHSYFDTQLSRLGGPNFHELPINAPMAQIHNNQRDGMHRQAIPRGRVAYEPNSLGGGCPFQAGMRGFVPFPEPVAEDKVRGKPEKFADHYSQARLFWNSQSPVEKNHIVGGFRFELSRVQVPAVRERVLSLLANVAEELVEKVAAGLGMPVPAAQPVLREVSDPEVSESTELSLFSRPGQAGVKTLRVALLVCDGVDGEPIRKVYQALAEAGAVPRFVGVRLGAVQPQHGTPIPVEIALEAAPSVLWDAAVLPGGEDALATLESLGQVGEFVKDQYRHCKPMLLLGESARLLERIGVPLRLADDSPDPGLVIQDAPHKTKDKSGNAWIAAFLSALEKRRHFEREMDPPRV